MPPQAATPSWAELGISPWTLFFALLLPLALYVFATRTFPTRRLAICFSLPCLASLLIPLAPSWWWIVAASLNGILFLVALADVFTVPALAHFSIERNLTRVASLGSKHPSELSLSYSGKRMAWVRVADDVVPGLVLQPAEHLLFLKPRSRVFLSQHIQAQRRGSFSLEYTYLALRSWGGLWQRLRRLPNPGTLHVYPNIRQIGEYALLARTNRLNLIGVRKTRRIGQENNFERLRDYQTDDNYKQIDWRSTARRQKLTVKQFQADQSQRVIFLLDCGRMMTNEHLGLSLVDYALNSILLLSYVALSQGDSVGMICFSDHIHKYVPPGGGKQQMNRLLHAGFDQFPRLVQSRFDEAFLYLSTHCRRRSLVVLVTNVIDQVNAEQIQDYMGNLSGCHLPLLVLLRDHSLFQFADHPASDPVGLYRSAAASQLLVWRHRVIRQMQYAGSMALDVFPEEMTSPLVNKYLEIKARHIL